MAVAVITYFGSPLPQTLAGKQGEIADLLTLSYSGAQWNWLIRDLGEVGTVVLLSLSMIGFGFLLKQEKWKEPLVASSLGWMLMVEVFYRWIQIPFAPWYHVMTMTLLLGLACWGMLQLAGILNPPALRPLLISALFLLVQGTSLSFLIMHAGQPPDPRWGIYQQVGEFLAQETDPGKVAMVEIGIVGYYAPEHEVLDLVGLVTPLVVKHGAEAAFEQMRPRYVVEASLFQKRFPFLTELEQDQWRLLQEFEDPLSGRGMVKVWEARVVNTEVQKSGATL
jgi:hypothetical protein